MAEKNRQIDREPDAGRRVVKANVDSYGSPLPEDGASVYTERQLVSTSNTRKFLIATIVFFVAILVGLIVALFSLTNPTNSELDVGSKQNEKVTWKQSIYAVGEGGAETLFAPTSVAVAKTGEIYVAEPQKARIDIFNPDGTFKVFIETIPEKGKEPIMIRPEGLTFDDDENLLYAADPTRGSIFVFSKEGALVKTIALGEVVFGSAIDGNKLYVLGEGRVHIYNKKTAKETGWFGSFGNYPGEINAYQGIVAKNGIIYIADSLNHRVQAFDPSGNLVWNTLPDSEESSASPFALPQDLTMDASSRLIVVDALNFSLIAVNPKDGKITGSWGEYGQQDGQFAYPSSVAYDSTYNRYIVADTKNNRVQIVELPQPIPVAKKVIKEVQMNPWRYIIIPAGIVLLLFTISRFVRFIRRKYRKDL